MSEVKVNKISPRTACGTVTLGDSGDTFTIPAGATITNNGTAAGFGATGAASWDTTVKTGDFTAVNGVGYFVNTTSGEIDVTLPASPSAGAVVAISDYANNFATNNCILLRNGSNIGGSAVNATLVVNGAAVTLVYVDATKGWIVTDSGNQSEASELATYVTATGGTITTYGNFKIHSFTGPGTFTVLHSLNSGGSNSVDYLVVAGGGGGGGGGDSAAGAGAGGYRFSNGTVSGCFSAGPSPLGASALPVSAQGYAIVVDGGGAAHPGSPSPDSRGTSGGVSSFSTITSAGGGGGGGGPGGVATPISSGRSGGSGGGAATTGGGPGSIGTGNTPPVSPPQGFNGGTGASDNATYRVGGGGGGAGAVGQSVTNPVPNSGGTGGAGGAGLTSCITASPVARGGGGGGGGHNNGQGPGPGGSGGGGAGAKPGAAVAGTTNTGGGGGGGAEGNFSRWKRRFRNRSNKIQIPKLIWIYKQQQIRYKENNYGTFCKTRI